jgi:hypothetical protein
LAGATGGGIKHAVSLAAICSTAATNGSMDGAALLGATSVPSSGLPFCWRTSAIAVTSGDGGGGQTAGIVEGTDAYGPVDAMGIGVGVAA